MAFFFVYGGVELGTGQLANTLLIESRGTCRKVTASSWVSVYWASFTVGRITMGLLALRLRRQDAPEHLLWFHRPRRAFALSQLE